MWLDRVVRCFAARQLHPLSRKHLAVFPQGNVLPILPEFGRFLKLRPAQTFYQRLPRDRYIGNVPHSWVLAQGKTGVKIGFAQIVVFQSGPNHNMLVYRIRAYKILSGAGEGRVRGL
jgi:hypothetical protein